MTLEQLRIFVAVAERLNMTRAAQALNLTQPSVSAAIAALEGRHGLSLFDRVGRGLMLSEAGRTFLPEARAVLARAQQAAEALDDLTGLRRGSLRVAASQTVATYWLPVRMARFAEHWPAVSLSLLVSNTKDAAAAVSLGGADLGFVEGECDEPSLIRQTVGNDRLGLYTRPDSPLATTRLESRHLRRMAWGMREAGSGTRAHLTEVLASVGIDLTDLNIRLELPSNDAVLEALEVGGLVTAVSELAAASRVASGQIIRLEWPFPRRDFAMLRHCTRRVSTAAQAFLRLVGAEEQLSG